MARKKHESDSLTFQCGCGKRHLKAKKILMIGETKWTLACLVENHSRITRVVEIQDQILKIQNNFIKHLGTKFDIDITKEMEDYTSDLEKQNNSNISTSNTDSGDDKTTSPPEKLSKPRKKKA